jgi:ssDNA-binding Zn-finger/Zn-ribbon topoisomerase 1
MNGLCGLLPKRVGRLMKIYVQQCPECGRNDLIVLTRDTILREYACACYRCDYFGPDAKTRRGAVRKWNCFSVEQTHKTITSGPFVVIVKREESDV